VTIERYYVDPAVLERDKERAYGATWAAHRAGSRQLPVMAVQRRLGGRFLADSALTSRHDRPCTAYRGTVATP
jgi:hypothetical protein